MTAAEMRAEIERDHGMRHRQRGLSPSEGARLAPKESWRTIAAVKQFVLPADELEYVVLRKLWELGTASVRDLHAQLDKPDAVVYTTIAKVIDRLRGKGLIERERHGRAFVYRASVARENVERARAQNAVNRLLGAAPHAAVAALVDAVDAVDPSLLDELERAVAAHRRSKRGA